MLSFGPVPSRRLGRSLGINNIPPKACTYACVYCQLKRTTEMHGVRREFYEPDEIYASVRARVEEMKRIGEPIDYLAFVPSGEPTLDINLGGEIERIRSIGIPIAVITNASLIWRADVRRDLGKADWVSLKIDSTREDLWRRINRPHGVLKLQSVLDGMMNFARSYPGVLTTETMLVAGLNDGEDSAKEIADLLARLNPAKAYLSIPTRPPAENWVTVPDESTLNRCYQIFNEHVKRVECLLEYEGNSFSAGGDVAEDLLNITSVHPMREKAVREYLRNRDRDWRVVEELLQAGRLMEVRYEGRRYYLRKFTHAS
jgi:wyosine [tRNA(Phe)-imidazoG37] synthetase (radical SAM superfamily)